MKNKRNIIEEKIEKVINKIKEIGGENIRFIMLYGSLIENRYTKLSDIDIAVYFKGNEKERFNFRMKILGRVGDEFDIQVFQDLPIYIQKEIISNGKMLEYENFEETFDIFMKTIRDYEHFKPRMDMYFSQLGE